MKLHHALLAVDLDGTLLDAGGQLHPRNRDALHRAHEAGLRVCIATGRSLSEARTVLDQLGLDLDAGVFAFGAVVSDLRHHRTIHRSCLSAKLTSELLAFFRGRGNPVLMLFDPQGGQAEYRLVTGERDTEVYEAWIRRSPCEVERADGWDDSEPSPLRVGVIERPGHIDDLVEVLNRRFDPRRTKSNRIYAPNYDVHVVECFAPHVSKWHGLQHLMKAWDIPAERVAAIGDDVNDLEMITHAGLGIAMGNAVDAVRAVADRHAPHHDAQGLAVAVEAILKGDPASLSSS